MPLEIFTPGQVLTAAECTLIANMLPYSVAKSAIYTSVPGDFVIMTGGHVVTLPAVATVGACVGLINADANAATGITGAGSAKILGPGLGSGTAAGTTVPVGGQGSYLVVESDGTNWQIIAGSQDSGWIAPSFTNSYASAGSTYYAISYRLIANRVYWRGAFTTMGSTGLAPMAALAAAYRPSKQIAVMCPGFGGTAGTYNILIDASGVSTLNYGGSPSQIFMDGLSYSID